MAEWNTSTRVPSRSLLRSLAAHDGAPAISIYIPTHRSGRETREDPIRLKNAFAEVDTRLRSARPWKLSAGEVQTLLNPVRSLIDRAEFWRRQGDSLAILLSGETIHVLRLPITVEQVIHIGRRFHVTPLVQASEGGAEFYVLALSRQHVRLLHGSATGVAEVDLADLPAGVDDIFLAEEKSDQLQFHSYGTGTGGGQTAVFHGQGGVDRQQREHTLHFLRLVNGAVCRSLHDSNAPLILAGEVLLHSLYREVNEYRHLLNECVEGNPDELSTQQLYDRTWPVVRDGLDRARRQQIEAVLDSARRGQGTFDLEAALQASATGRVATLVLAAGEQQWGCYDAEAGRVQPLPHEEEGAEDLINLTAIQTIRHDGRVIVFDRESLSENVTTVAGFRF